MSRLVAFSALIATSALVGCNTPSAVTSPAVATPPTSVEAIGETRPGSGVLNGYLPRAALPDSLALLPPPPLAGSPAAQADEAVFRQTRALAGSPRWALAAQDANLQFPAAAGVFACSLGFDVTPEQTPHLYTLLRRTLPDAGLSTYKAKDHYKRLRPFAALGGTSCTPDDEAKLAKDGSYPSGHSALGWAWALILAELAPDKANAILARGTAYAQSRVICGVHWQSDADQGRMMGAATVARLHADPVFKAQLQAAGNEVKQALAAGKPPAGRDCGAEAAALSNAR